MVYKVEVLKLGQSVGSHGCWFCCLQKNWPSKPALGWSIWIQFLPKGGWDFEQLILQKVRMPWGGLPWGGGNVEALNWLMHKIRAYPKAVKLLTNNGLPHEGILPCVFEILIYDNWCNI